MWNTDNPIDQIQGHGKKKLRQGGWDLNKNWRTTLILEGHSLLI